MDQLVNGGRLGEKTEQRFFGALEHHGSDEPQWFYGIEEASSFLDIRGVDFIAWIKYPSQREPLPVPIQVKSLNRQVSEYYEKHPMAKEADIPVFVVDRRTKRGTIRADVFRKLGTIRNSGTMYTEYFDKVTRKPLTGRALLVYKALENRRAARAPATLEPAPPRITFLPPPMGTMERFLHRLWGILRTARS